MGQVMGSGFDLYWVKTLSRVTVGLGRAGGGGERVVDGTLESTWGRRVRERVTRSVPSGGWSRSGGERSRKLGETEKCGRDTKG